MDKTEYNEGSEPSAKEHSKSKINQHFTRAYADEYGGQIEHHPERGVKGHDKKAVLNDPDRKNTRRFRLITL